MKEYFKLVITLFILGYASISFSQVPNRNLLISISDSTLKSKVGASYWKYFYLDSNSIVHYSDTTKLWLFSGNKPTGKFKQAYVFYKLSDPDIPELRCRFEVAIDSKLRCTAFYKEVPKFIIENKPFDLITQNTAKDSALTNLINDKKKVHLDLSYDKDCNKFIWTVYRDICTIEESVISEYIKIDAITGQVLGKGTSLRASLSSFNSVISKFSVKEQQSYIELQNLAKYPLLNGDKQHTQEVAKFQPH